VLSSPPLPILLLPSGLLLLLEEDEAVSEAEERQLVSTAVNNIATSAAGHLLTSRAAHMLSESKPASVTWPVLSVPGGDVPKPACSSQAIVLNCHGLKPSIPVVRDKAPTETACEQSNTPYPNTTPHCRISRLWSLSLKADISKRQVAVNVIVEVEKRVSLPGAQTAPAPSKPSPVHPSQAQSISSLLREGPKQHAKDVVMEKTRVNSPAHRESTPRLSECSDEQPQLTRALSNKYPPLREVKAMPHARHHPCRVVSGVDMTSDKCSHFFHEAVRRQSRPHYTEGRSFERSEVCQEFTSQARGAVLLETAVNTKRDTTEDVSSHDNSSDAQRDIPYSLVVALPPNLEPITRLWAQLFDSAHLPDTLQESEVVSKCPDMGCLNSPQAGLEAAIRQPPESRLRLIDTVAALTHARLARRAVSEEFRLRVPKMLPDKSVAGEGELHPRIPKIPPGKHVARDGEGHPRVTEYPPNGFPGMDKRLSSNIVNKTTRTSTDYSPTRLSLPETPPAFLSQVLIPARDSMGQACFLH
jgi:hypothetical protein